MSIPTSENRVTSEGTPMVHPSCTNTPSLTAKESQGFSKAGRRVLAELACNDSPVIGLLPPGTPASCKQKSSSGGPLRIRRALLSNLPSHPASTPLGESLLRSQVQLLLQKVESDMCAPPCLRATVHPSVCSGFMVSPTMLAAPTPLNTPAATAPMMQDSQPICEVNVKNASTDETLGQSASTDGSYVDTICLNEDVRGTVGFFDGHVLSGEVQNGLPVKEKDVLSASGSFTTFVSTTTCLDMKPLQPTPLLSEVSDVPSPSEIFPGKRVLHFDEDTPCKPSPTEQYDTMMFDESGSHSLVRELDDDELSEWSVHVNVGSPADKQSVIEQAEVAENGNSQEVNEGFSSSIHEHVTKIQQKCSSKVDLLWHKGRARKAMPFSRENEHCDEGGEETDANAEYSEQYYFGNEEIGYEEDEGECDNLCDVFKEMRFEETERKGLPRGEGKHIRFLYGEDEDDIVEAIVVKGEDEVVRGCAATRLKGIPAPSGRHWRFVQEDEEEEERASSQ